MVKCNLCMLIASRCAAWGNRQFRCVTAGLERGAFQFRDQSVIPPFYASERYDTFVFFASSW